LVSEHVILFSYVPFRVKVKNRATICDTFENSRYHL
jgi:hypothetical protein